MRAPAVDIDLLDGVPHPLHRVVNWFDELFDGLLALTEIGVGLGPGSGQLGLEMLDELLADKKLSPAVRLAELGDFDAVLGLDLATLTREALRVAPAGATIAPNDIAARLAERREARAAKDFARSDAIRDDLAAAGVEVMDGDPLGWDWKLAL